MINEKPTNILEILTPEQSDDLEKKYKKLKESKCHIFSKEEVFAEAYSKFGINEAKHGKNLQSRAHRR